MMEITSCMLAECYNKNVGLYWAFVAFAFVTSSIAILGNSLVIYAAQQTANRGRLRYLDSVVKSLAMTDLLYGLIGAPFTYVNFYLGGYSIFLTREGK